MNNEQAKRIMEISKKTYEMIAADFSATRNRVWPEMEISVKKYVRPGMKVLDLGCGNGRLVETLPEVEYWGVDESEGLIGEAENKSKIQISKKIQNLKSKINFKVLNMLELGKLGEKDFDVVFMFASLNHIAGEENRLKVLEDIKKILKPGGMVVMTNWNMWQVGAGKNIWKYKFSIFNFQFSSNFQLLNFQTKRGALGLKDVTTRWQSGDKKRQGELYYRAFGFRELRKLFLIAGFEVTENYYSLDGRKVYWWNGRNIVSVGKYNG